MSNDQKPPQSGQSTLSTMYQSGRTKLFSMQQSFATQHPEIASHLSSMYDSASHMAQQGRMAVSQKIDHGMQQLGVSATNSGRDMVKFTPNPQDGYIRRYQKMAFNYGVDVVADNMEKISHAAQGFSSGVGEKMGPGTFDRLNPAHLATLVAHPDLVKRYMSQRKTQLMQPIDFYREPKSFTKKKFAQAKNSFWNVHERVSELDGGFTGKVSHGGRAFVDFTQEKIAPMLGVGIGTFMIYNMSQQRKKTNQAMDSMFPKSTLYGKMARFTPTKFMLTKPLARIRGNPALSLGLLAYGMATSVGKSIGDSMELQKTLPATHQRLKDSGVEMYRSSTQLDVHHSIKRTSKRQK